MTNRSAAAALASIDWDAPDPEGERMARENDEAARLPLAPRESIVLMAYQELAQRAATGADFADLDGNVWGVTVFLDDMWPLVVGDLSGRDEVRAVLLALSARTEGEFSSVVEDEFGETRVVLDAGILG